jgi:hypothetical protein
MRWIGLAIVCLYVLSIPWYRTPGVVPEVVLGLPDWVVVAIGCYVAIAALTAFAWLYTPFEDEDRQQ